MMKMDVNDNKKGLIYDFEGLDSISGKEKEYYNSSINILFGDNSNTKIVVMVKNLLPGKNIKTEYYIFNSYYNAKSLINAYLGNGTVAVTLYEVISIDDTIKYTELIHKKFHYADYIYNNKDIIYTYDINSIRNLFILGAKIYKCF